MTRPMVHFMSSIAMCWLAAATSADEPLRMEPRPERGPEGQSVRQYTKEWTDDYYNYNRVVYFAYSKTLTDETGTEVAAEIWHGRATGYHQNGRKAWEGLYHNGLREGEYTTWAENGARTGLAHVTGGQVHGTSTQWAADGRKVREETYRRGKLHGESRWWAPDGKLAALGTYQDGLPWEGGFVELDPAPPRSRCVVRYYERGQKIREEEVPGGTANWW